MRRRSREKSSVTLREVLQRSIILMGILIFIVDFVAATYFTYYNIRQNEKQHQKLLHNTITELIVPSLLISDYEEAKRLLGMVSKDQEILAAVTPQGDVLLSDYSLVDLVESSFDLKRKPLKCGHVLKKSPVFNETLYRISCSEMLHNDPLGGNPILVGVLLGYTVANPTFAINISSFVFVALALTTLLILLILSRFILERRLLVPLESLTKMISAKSVNPLQASPELDTIAGAPKEVGTLTRAFENLINSFQREAQEKNEASKRAALYDLAKQIAHDVRSPLAALNMMLPMIDEVPEEKRLILRSAVTRIQDIANGLLGNSRKTILDNQRSISLLAGLVDTLVSEKRIQYRSNLNLELEANLHPNAAYGLFASVESTEFKRVLSNLIDNSVEASPTGEKTRIAIDVRCQGDRWILLSVKDDGRGIAPEILPQLMREQKSFGKPNGSGLGLFHARQVVERWGGSIEIASEVNRGTTVTIKLPKARSPKWFVPTIEIGKNTSVVVVDDDTSIHQIWQSRFEAIGSLHGKFLHFVTPQLLKDWKGNSPDSEKVEYLFLIDQEFRGSSETGLQLIELLGIEKQSILVTSHSEDLVVQEVCSNKGIGLLPKTMAACIPIELPSAPSSAS